MQGGWFTYGLLTALAIALLVAVVTDCRRRQIDNWLTGAIALGAPAFWMVSDLSWPGIGLQIVAGSAALVVFAGLFALGWMGGGDVKLLAALALWIQPAWFVQLVLVMAAGGGVLTLVFGAWHIARRQRDRVAVPYGIAISGAALWVLASQYLPAFRNDGIFG